MLDNNHQSQRVALKSTQPSHENAAERQRLDELLDEALKETFPASDPVAIAQQAPERMQAKRLRRPDRE
jgi:hypothetical protein